MKKVYSVLFLILVSYSIIPYSINSNATNQGDYSIKTLTEEENAFKNIYGSPGYTGLAIDQAANLIFTNSYKGLAVFQLDDLSNSSHYGVEIGLSEATIFDLEIDTDLKLLYISTVGNVDVLNYSKTPYQVQNVISGNFGVFELTENVIVDPNTHYAWIASRNEISVYNPLSDSFVDVSEYNLPTSKINTIEYRPNIKNEYLFVGTDEGIYQYDLENPSNPVKHNTTADGLPYNKTTMIKYNPGLNRAFISTQDSDPNTGFYGGLTVLFLNNNTIKSYNFTDPSFNPLPVIDVAMDTASGLGYIASFSSANAECGMVIFDLDTLEGIARSAQGSYTMSPSMPFITAGPDPEDYMESGVEGLLVEVDVIEQDTILIGTVQRLQILTYTGPGTSTVENGPVIGLYHNIVGDVNYDPIDEKMYVSNMLGLDRIDVHNAEMTNIDHLIHAPGAGGNTAGELLVEDRLMFHHHYLYNITHDTTHEMEDILPLEEYNHIVDISSSPNQSVIYYATETDDNGNGSMILYNWETGFYSVHDFGFNKTLLKVREVLPHPTEDILYVATNKGLVKFDLESLTVIEIFEENNWDVTSLAWIEDKIWIGLDASPLVRTMDSETEVVEIFDKSYWIPTLNDIYHVEETEEIIFTTNRGFYVFNMSNEEVKWEGEDQGLSSLFVSKVAYSPETNEAYLGSFLGLNIYNMSFDNVAPELEISGIKEGDILSGIVEISVEASDYSGIDSVEATLTSNEFRLRAQYMQENEQNTMNWVWTHTLNTTKYTNGSYTYTFTAWDNNSISTTKIINFEIQNEIDEEPTEPTEPTDTTKTPLPYISMLFALLCIPIIRRYKKQQN